MICPLRFSADRALLPMISILMLTQVRSLALGTKGRLGESNREPNQQHVPDSDTPLPFESKPKEPGKPEGH